MHRCLLVPELAIKIAEECVTWPNPNVIDPNTDGADLKEALGTLNSLSRTCQALVKPALDAMWYQQNTLSHLLRCLPDDLWEMTNGVSSYDVGQLVSHS